MSTASQSLEQATFFLVKVGNSYKKYAVDVPLPDGAATITQEALENSSKEDLEEAYAAIAGTSVKKFKSKELALENVVYQVGKMPTLSSSAPVTQPASAEKAEKKTYVRKSPSNYKLVVDESSQDKLKVLSPQARSCIDIMADFAKKVGRFEFQEKELKDFFESEKARLNTKQDPWRILMYYRSKLISADLLRVS